MMSKSVQKSILRGLALAVVSSLLVAIQAFSAQAQWATNGTNINNTNTGNVGIGITAPAHRLDVSGAVNASGGLCILGDCRTTWSQASGGWTSNGTNTNLANSVVNIWSGGRAAVPGGYMKPGSLTIGSIVESYGGGTGWTSNTAGLMLETTADTEIAVHDSHSRVASLMWYEGDAANRITIGRNMGWGTISTIALNGNVGVGTSAPTFSLDVTGTTDKLFRVRHSGGLEFISTSLRTGTYGSTAAVSLANNRLIVESNGHTGGNETIIRHLVNGLQFAPSDHPDLPGVFRVVQVGGTSGLAVDQQANGNVGIGTGAPQSKLHVAGDIRVDGNISAKYQDVAEWVPSTQKLSAGTVVILDQERSNQVLASATSYDTKVAGVVSAQPGISLGEAGEGKVLVATTGRVKVKVDATRAPVRIGDLLVTSDLPGVAMKSEPIVLGSRRIHEPGTLIGKALESLDKGTGEILVLLSLQ